MLNLKAEIRGINKTKSAIVNFKRHKDDAMEAALKVTSYRYKMKLQSEIRQGAPGGRVFGRLTHLAKHTGRPKDRSALRRLANGVRYSVKLLKPFTMAVGFTNYSKFKRTRGFTSIAKGGHPVSSSWLNKARIHQEGFTRVISDAQRRLFARMGARLLGWRKGKSNTKAYAGHMSNYRAGDYGGMPFFLKKSTTVFRTPARPIIQPFWHKHRTSIRKSIMTNFRQKMNGVRI